MEKVSAVSWARDLDCSGVCRSRPDHSRHGERLRVPVQAPLGPSCVKPHGLAFPARVHEAFHHDGTKLGRGEQAGISMERADVPLAFGRAGVHSGGHRVCHGNGDSPGDSDRHAVALRGSDNWPGYLPCSRIAVLRHPDGGDDRRPSLRRGAPVLRRRDLHGFAVSHWNTRWPHSKAVAQQRELRREDLDRAALRELGSRGLPTELLLAVCFGQRPGHRKDGEVGEGGLCIQPRGDEPVPLPGHAGEHCDADSRGVGVLP